MSISGDECRDSKENTIVSAIRNGVLEGELVRLDGNMGKLGWVSR